MFSLNPRSGTPIYRQLIDQVRRMISSAQLKPGDQLPSVRELALSHAVNPMTISKAYSQLENDGLLERRRGIGMMVAARPVPRESKAARLKHLQGAIDQLAVAARQLELDADDVTAAVKKTMEKNND